MSSLSSNFWNNISPKLLTKCDSDSSSSTTSILPLKERLKRAASSSTIRSTIFNNVVTVPSTPTAQSSIQCSDLSSISSWNYNDVGIDKISHNFVSGLSVIDQENFLIYELLYCLTGMRGQLIEPVEEVPNSDIYRNFKVNEGIHNSLRDNAQQILPLAGYFSVVKRFIDEKMMRDEGQVQMALVETLSSMMKDYYLLLARYEKEWKSGKLTLRKLHYYLRPTTNIMKVLSDIVLAIRTRELHGGDILTMLINHSNAHIGNDEAQKVLCEIIDAAVKPYMAMLDLWLEKGIINDPYKEFFVEDNDIACRDLSSGHYSLDYWEKRYMIRPERIPSFLEKCSDVILRTGKYLNCISQCGCKTEKDTQEIQIVYSQKTKEYIYEIERAYKLAAANLLDVILYDNDLKGHLQTVKNFFLMQKGDFMSQFMDASENELSKPIENIIPSKLENILGLTVRSTSAVYDLYTDAVHCQLLPDDLITQLTKIFAKDVDMTFATTRNDMSGLYCFAFKYEAKWPISLVLNHIAISKYQLIYRQLFICRHVERELEKLWQINYIERETKTARAAFALRQRMLHAVQNLEYYMLIEVIEPNWHTFEQNIARVENLDEVLACHQDFLDSTLKNCMLTNCLKLNRMIFKLYAICLKFAALLQNYNNNEKHEQYGDAFEEQVEQKCIEFTDALLHILVFIRNKAKEMSNDRLLNLLHRMNYNEFYTQELERKNLQNLEELLVSNDVIHEVTEIFKNLRMTFTNNCNISPRSLISVNSDCTSFESLQTIDSAEFHRNLQWE